MALTSGTKLGPYEIQSPLGAGGMGEVYRARDPRLDREVAIKVLPASLSSDPSLKQRLEREAKAISKLSHPHICALHDIGHQDGVDFLVMEYLEGETLEQRLMRGALPPEQTLRYAAQIADALAKAHKLGITHRDLKPANVMLTKSGAKLLDFGLAKHSGTAPLADALTEMTQDQAKLTSAGMIVGTFQYMAPEQLEGKEADARTDIFALGELIHEMATGKPAFSGKSRASLIAAILTTEPAPISQLQPMTPVALEHVVKKCLAKDPDERWQSAGDLASELHWISQSSAQALQPARRQSRRNGAFVVAAGAAVLFATLAGIQYWRMRTATAPNFEFSVTAPEKTTLETVGLAGAPVVSPDGKTIAFLATTTVGVKSLWVRPLESTEARSLPGTENAVFPFWSPDSRLLAFFAEGQLKKVAINGGVPIAICAATEGRGGTWSDLGFILFGLRDGPLQKVSAAGGGPMAITQLDKSRLEASHRFPVLLPDDDHYLFVVQAAAGHPYLSGGSLKSGRRLTDFPNIDSSVAYNQGYLLFVRGATLFAQTFDLARFQFSGDQVAVAEKVQADAQFNFAVLSVSRDGELVFQGGATSLGSQLLQLDRTGKQLGIVSGAGRNWTLRLSPSGTQLLVEMDESTPGRSAIWLCDLVASTRTRLTFNEYSGYPVWSHDGRKMAFNVGVTSNEVQVHDLASGAESTLFSDPGSGSSFVADWSPDDRYVFYDLHRPGANWETWVVESAGQHNRYPLLQATSDARWARLSPDGKWLAYAGNETGRPEIYVVPVDFAGAQPKAAGNKSQISTDGGNIPVWARDGKELFFTNAAGTTLYAAPFTTTGGVPRAGTASKLFDLSQHSYAFFYDVSPDGKKFYVAEAPPGSSPPLTVVTNWQARIKK
jgi:eukaryotic-like serine/threonine-protein kinase